MHNRWRTTGWHYFLFMWFMFAMERGNQITFSDFICTESFDWSNRPVARTFGKTSNEFSHWNVERGDPLRCVKTQSQYLSNFNVQRWNHIILYAASNLASFRFYANILTLLLWINSCLSLSLCMCRSRFCITYFVRLLYCRISLYFPLGLHIISLFVFPLLCSIPLYIYNGHPYRILLPFSLTPTLPHSLTAARVLFSFRQHDEIVQIWLCHVRCTALSY